MFCLHFLLPDIDKVTGAPSPPPTTIEVVEECSDVMTSPTLMPDVTTTGTVEGSQPTDLALGDETPYKIKLLTDDGKPAFVKITLPKTPDGSSPRVENIDLKGTVLKATVTIIGRYSQNMETVTFVSKNVDMTNTIILADLRQGKKYAPMYVDAIIISPLSSTDGSDVVSMDLAIQACVEAPGITTYCILRFSPKF